MQHKMTGESSNLTQAHSSSSKPTVSPRKMIGTLEQQPGRCTSSVPTAFKSNTKQTTPEPASQVSESLPVRRRTTNVSHELVRFHCGELMWARRAACHQPVRELQLSKILEGAGVHWLDYYSYGPSAATVFCQQTPSSLAD